MEEKVESENLEINHRYKSTKVFFHYSLIFSLYPIVFYSSIVRYFI